MKYGLSNMARARSLRDLTRRMRDFVERDRSRRAATLSLTLREQFLHFDRVGIVGGMVRDFARESAAHFRSDVDLVIEAPATDVDRLAGRLGAQPNRFGGYGWSSGGWKIDFWALDTTWAAQQGHVSVSSLNDVTKCVFFDWDAVVYDLKVRKVICAPDYLDRIAQQRLDLTLPPTPSVEGNLLRALRRIIIWDVAPGTALRDFVHRHLTDERFAVIAASERRLYSRRVTQEYSSAAALRMRFDAISIQSEMACQLSWDFPRVKKL